MSSPLEVNRADLAWAINSCLPHTGRRELDFVGFSFTTPFRELDVYSTDGYTVAVAKVATDFITLSAPVSFGLVKKEARDLLQFIRPTLKRHQDEMVQLLAVPSELHVALPGEQPESESLTGAGRVNPPANDPDASQNGTSVSEVYEAQLPGKDFQAVYGVLDNIKRREIETAHSLPFHPDTFARFAKAARYETDRLNLSPRQSEGFVYGASYITVGDNFEGAIAGLSYEKPALQEENAA